MMISKKYTLWALNPLLLTMMAPAVAQQTDDETFVVSANRSNRTVAEMAQTTWVIENAELEQQIQGGKELKDALAQLIPGLDVSIGGVKIIAFAVVLKTDRDDFFHSIPLWGGCCSRCI